MQSTPMMTLRPLPPRQASLAVNKAGAGLKHAPDRLITPALTGRRPAERLTER